MAEHFKFKRGMQLFLQAHEKIQGINPSQAGVTRIQLVEVAGLIQHGLENLVGLCGGNSLDAATRRQVEWLGRVYGPLSSVEYYADIEDRERRKLEDLMKKRAGNQRYRQSTRGRAMRQIQWRAHSEKRRAEKAAKNAGVGLTPLPKERGDSVDRPLSS